MVGGLMIKGEKIPKEKVKTETVKTRKGCINEAGKDEDPVYIDKPGTRYCYTDGSKPIDFYQRLHRVHGVEGFIKDYKFARGEKICIHPDGKHTCVVSGYCFDSTLVGVHGMQSICVVFRRDMDMTRLHFFYQKESMTHHNMRMLSKAAISEVECLPHKDVRSYDDDFRRSCTVTVKKPFAVVSQGLDTLDKSGYKVFEFSPRFLLPKTIDYLESVVSSDALHTHYGIIQVAIKAYQMCHKELRADDIWVTIMDVKTGHFDYLPMDIIGEQLDLVNGLSSDKDPEKPLFVSRGCLC